MEKIFIGKITSFHGVKGEIRIISNFPYKEKCFLVGNHIIIDNKTYTITSYRVHKQYDMITLEGYTNLDQVLFLRNKNVYQDKSEMKLTNNQYVDEELLKCIIQTTTGLNGKLLEIFDSGNNNKVLRLEINDKIVLVPYNEEFVKKIDIKNKIIVIELLEGM